MTEWVFWELLNSVRYRGYKPDINKNEFTSVNIVFRIFKLVCVLKSQANDLVRYDKVYQLHLLKYTIRITCVRCVLVAKEYISQRQIVSGNLTKVI